MRLRLPVLVLTSCFAAVAVLPGCYRSGRPDYAKAMTSRSADIAWSAEPQVPKKLPRGAREMLARNGFVVLGGVESWSVTAGYFKTTQSNFITADAVLYVFHCLFRGGLSAYEKEKLIPLAHQIADAGLIAARRERETLRRDALLAEPARRNVVFFAVAKGLLDGAAPGDEAAEVAPLIDNITAATEWGFYPAEDFTMYKPRGAYAEDEELARYFRAMTWLSRVILPVIPGGQDAEPEAAIKLRQAYLLGRLLERGQLREDWQRLYDDIGFFIAQPDSFTPLKFLDVVRRIPGPTDDRWVAAVRREFARPEYPVSKIIPVLQAGPGDAPSKYVQFMGARYIPDGQIHQEVTYPHVQGRTLPKGLDIGYALFDSDRAQAHLADEFARYPDLSPALERLHGLFAQYASEPEPKSIYAGWIGAVREIVRPQTSPHIARCFTTEAWRDKSLNTALASWTQMRDDFALYAKEPMVPGCAGRSLLVEPVPAAYDRLEKLSGKLADRGFSGMADLRDLCGTLAAVSRLDLDGVDWQSGRTTLTAKQCEHMKVSFSELACFAQWLLQHFTELIGVERPCVVVDVASDSNPPQRVLHEATGPLDLIVADTGDGIEHRGWALSYYEFTTDQLKRLTDKEWEDRVDHGRHRAARPEWTKSYMYGN